MLLNILFCVSLCPLCCISSMCYPSMYPLMCVRTAFSFCFRGVSEPLFITIVCLNVSARFRLCVFTLSRYGQVALGTHISVVMRSRFFTSHIRPASLAFHSVFPRFQYLTIPFLPIFAPYGYDFHILQSFFAFCY